MTLKDEAESMQSGWELWRQDDNGVRALIGRYTDRREALALLQKFEASHHKQTYWIEKTMPAASAAVPRPEVEEP